MNNWLKIALLTSLPVLGHAHSMSPFLLPEVFDTNAGQNISFQSAITIEKFFIPGINFKTTYVVTEPDGQQKPVEAAASLKRFNIAEMETTKEGTYHIRTKDAVGNAGKYALVDGRWLRVRAVRPQTTPQAPRPAEAVKAPAQAAAPAQPPRMIAADQVPANAQTLEVANHLIAETYVTKGKPTALPKLTNKGFEVKLLTHPSELYEGESLKLQALVDGKPVPNLELDVFKGASSYEPNEKREMPHVKTNAKGEAEIKFSDDGIYLITASYPEANPDNTKKPAAANYTYGLTVQVNE